MHISELEQRRLLAGITYEPSDFFPRIIVEGTESGDVITVSKSGSNLVITGSSPANYTKAIADVGVVEIHGNGGSDKITVSTSLEIDESITGDAGNDTITAGGSGEFTLIDLEGGKGNDLITAGPGGAEILGGDGNDTLTGGSGFDSLFGDAGNDSLSGASKDDQLEGDDGNDTLLGGAGDDTLSGGVSEAFSFKVDRPTEDLNGNDSLKGGSGNDSMIGGNGKDTLVGESGTDALFGDFAEGDIGPGGDDLLMPGTGKHEFTLGGPGRDTVSFADRTDNLVLNLSTNAFDSGGVGDGDKLFGDNLTGGSGNDIINGDSKANTLLGGKGNDVISGNGGNDSIGGDDGDDSLSGGSGKDTIHGNAGKDTVIGGADVDLLFGDADNDTMSSKDSLKETVDGGTGTDTFTSDAIDVLLNKP